MSVNRHPRLLTAGITFRDLVISGIDELPGLGEERYGTDFVTTWGGVANTARIGACLLYTSPSPRDRTRSRMPSSA